MNACPALPSGDQISLTVTLRAVDCNVDAAVAAGYARLFGEGGALGLALTVCLTIYVALYGYRLLFGRAGLTVSGAAIQLATIGAILTFAASWPAYQSVAVDLMTNGPQELANVVLNADGDSGQTFAQRVDQLVARLLTTPDAAPEPAKADGGSLISDIRVGSAIALGLGTGGLLVVAKIVLAALLALGPVFIVLMLFDVTRGLFAGWLRTALFAAFVPLIATLLGAGATAAIDQVLRSFEDAASFGEPPLGAALALAGASAVYLALLAAALWTAGSLTRSFRLPRVTGMRRPAAPSIAAEAAVRSPRPMVEASAGHARILDIAVAAGRNAPSAVLPARLLAAQITDARQASGGDDRRPVALNRRHPPYRPQRTEALRRP